MAVPAQEQQQQQQQQKASIGRRAWRLLRLAMLWARNGGAVHSLRLLSNLRRAGLSLGVGGGRGDRLQYGEREFSIDETPAFRFRAPSARVLRLIPCIVPTVPDTPSFSGDEHRYFFSGPEPECSIGYYDGEPSQCDEEEASAATTDGAGGGDDAGVDAKAEEFIAKFHAQMKLQRQISWLQYNEMMERSIR
ncbi:hypothetical protein GUJ93_ZPchr0003g18267 [Zizania palustris]|uniref:Uncharacterized protein n=1 Tax=Zizania palustris TaxID=103762 RepID=A0A8J5RZG7_ZIZPA|nr:hypothetical protein GUJ93_ZPchr0003g18267 [Zizania palustris]